MLTPSLLLGSSFLVLVVSVHQLASQERKIWSHAAVAFATAYTVLISIVYFVQLTLVAPRLARGQSKGIEMFLFVPFDSFLYAVDILGYSFMSVATLFAAMVFTGARARRAGVLDRKWLATSLPCAANVLPSSNMDRRALGGDFSGINMVARYAVSTRSNYTNRPWTREWD